MNYDTPENTIKKLGKIKRATYGNHPDRPHLIGLQLEFGGESFGVSDGGKHMVNMNYVNGAKDSEDEQERLQDTKDALYNVQLLIERLLRETGKQNVEELAGTPVEVTLNVNFFYDFRILTEVL